MPKSHDMVHKRRRSRGLAAEWTRRAHSGLHAPRAGGKDCAGATVALACKGPVPHAALGLATRVVTSWGLRRDCRSKHRGQAVGGAGRGTR